MRLSEPTAMDIGQVIKRLCAIHNRPYKADMDAMVTEWHDGLRRFSREVLDEAVTRARDDDDFPRLPRFRKYCFAIERDRSPKAADRGVDPEIQCPDCGEHITWHSVIITRTDDNIPFVTSKEFIDHRDGCPALPYQRRMFRLYGWSWADGVEPRPESLQERNTRKEAERRKRRQVLDRDGQSVEPRRHKDSVAASEVARLADVVPDAKLFAPPVRRETPPAWDDIPLPDPPPDAVLATR